MPWFVQHEFKNRHFLSLREITSGITRSYTMKKHSHEMCACAAYTYTRDTACTVHACTSWVHTRPQSVTFVIWRSWYVGQEAGVTNKWLDSRWLVKRHTPLAFVAPNFHLLPNLDSLLWDRIFRTIVPRKDDREDNALRTRFRDWHKVVRINSVENHTVNPMRSTLQRVRIGKWPVKVEC